METTSKREALWGLMLAAALAVTAVAQEAVKPDPAVVAAELLARQTLLDQKEVRLNELEESLNLQAVELKTASEQRSNLDLRKAVLEARRSLVAWRRALQQYTLNLKLSERGIVSAREVDLSRETSENAELAYKDAILSLDQARLDILKEAALVTVTEARVYRTEAVRKSVDITLANLSNLGKARVAYHESNDDELAGVMRVPDIRVSLRSGAIIAEPYVQRIEKLDLGEQHVLTYELLQPDIEELTVDITYFDKTASEKVFLRKDSDNDLPTVRSLNFDQTGKLGTTITFDLVMERLAETEKTYRLAVLNLPPELRIQFRDTEKKATVSAVKFGQDLTKKKLEAEIIIPEEMDLEKLDQPVTFYVLALDDPARESLLELKRQRSESELTQDDLRRAAIAHERLVFTPKGVAMCEVSSSDLYNEITAGDELAIKFQVKNSGSVPLHNIRMDIRLPADWEQSLNPEVIRELDILQEKTVEIKLFPSPDIGVGDYTVRVDAELSYEGQGVSVDDKIVRIHVASRANLIGGIILLGLLGGALVAIAVFLVRLARR